MLAVFLRALVAPVYLVLLAALGPLAALGLAVAFFQGVLGHPEITYFVPLAAGVLLIALGSDYNIFLVGRIWDEAERLPLREAIVAAGSGASHAISAAGLVLSASFAALALVPVEAFQQLAFVLAVGPADRRLHRPDRAHPGGHVARRRALELAEPSPRHAPAHAAAGTGGSSDRRDSCAGAKGHSPGHLTGTPGASRGRTGGSARPLLWRRDGGDRDRRHRPRDRRGTAAPQFVSAGRSGTVELRDGASSTNSGVL